MVPPHILTILMLSLVWALFELRLTIIFSILLAVKLVVRNLLSVEYLRFVESLQQLFSKIHWLEKKGLKSSVVFLEICYKTIFTK